MESMLRSNANWNFYKIFVVVCETRNMHKAANILGITRAAVSHNMKELSKQLGVELFISSNKGVVLTNEAINIYPIIKDGVESFTLAESITSKLNDENKTSVKMAISGTSVEILINRYVKEFDAKYPKIRLEISDLKDIDLVKQQQEDFVNSSKRTINQSLKAINLYTTNPIFLASKDFLKKHELTNTISKDLLFKFPVIVHKGTIWAEQCKQECEKDDPSMIRLVASSNMIYSMSQDSIGIGLISRETLGLLGGIKGTNLVPLNVDGITFKAVQIVCGYNKALTRPARTFVDGFLKFCKSQLPLIVDH